MIQFIGDDETFNFLSDFIPNITKDIGVESAQKLIVCEHGEDAVRAINAGILINIPILGLLDGFKGILTALCVECKDTENCAEGKQEQAIVDTDCRLFSGLESVINICRGRPVAVLEDSLPVGLDCVARSESGEIIAFAPKSSDSALSQIYGVNAYLASGLTPDGKKIIENFINL